MTSPPPSVTFPDRNPPSDQLVYLGAGPLLAILLGFALIPLRESVGASNLTFAFVVLTVVVSAFGGRGAGVATALASALSLDFFLTRPYLSLRIQENHDAIAFVGLTVCGLVAASLGAPHRMARLRELRLHSGLLQQSLSDLEGAGPLEGEIAGVLERSRQSLPVKALVVRDLTDRVVAAVPHRAGLDRISPEVLEAETLLSPGRSRESLRAAPSLPAEGARLALVSHQRQVGWLDLWGDGSPATVAARHTLTAVARIVGVMLARETAR
jgi:hypothetical protein